MLTQERTRYAWDEIAAGYDEFVTPSNISLAQESLHLAGLRPDMNFLDVAAGTGALSLPAARLGAQVMATDISPAMVERLNARARQEGLSNMEGRVMDGHQLDLEDNTFDISGSQFGVMLMPDLPKALSEMARVTRTGGRVLITSFGPPTQVEFLGFFLSAIKTAIPGFTGLSLDPPPLPFQVAKPEKLRQEMGKAGLKDIRVEKMTHELEFHSPEHMWDWVTNSNPIGADLVADLSQEEVYGSRQALDEMLSERTGESGNAILTNRVHIGMGTK